MLLYHYSVVSLICSGCSMGNIRKSTFRFKSTLVILSALSLYSGKYAKAQGQYPTERQLTFDNPNLRINNVYAPRLIYQTINGQQTLVMYFGGWYQTNPSVSPTDAIYRAVCTAPDSCGTPQKVIDPQVSGLGSAGLLNNPTIVEIQANGQDILVMYMVGVASDQIGAGKSAPNNKIYYSTSFASDGVNWSTPALLIQNAWLPSATLDSRKHVLLYVNSNGSDTSLPFQFVYDLGTSGNTYISAKPVTNPGGVAYVNSFVAYRSPPTNLFQIVSEHYYNPQVDYLSSVDGLSWTIMALNILPNATTLAGSLTPSTHPGTSCWVYFGKNTAFQHSNIYLKSWC